MTPYLSLERGRRKQIQDLLKESIASEDVRDAVLSTLEEYGDDEEALWAVLRKVERKCLAPRGFERRIRRILEARPHRRREWRHVKRHKVV